MAMTNKPETKENPMVMQFTRLQWWRRIGTGTGGGNGSNGITEKRLRPGTGSGSGGGNGWKLNGRKLATAANKFRIATNLAP
jgi:hypothetical protein